MTERRVEDLLRGLAPEVLGVLVRRYGHFDLAEDAVQEALLAASRQWPAEGVPDSPRGWLVTVASRRLVDLLRSEQARREREGTVAQWTLDSEPAAATEREPSRGDDTLILLFMCCHPALSAASQIALTLGAVAGLTTGEIARAFLVSEETMTRRITRAKQTIQASGQPFRTPTVTQRPDWLRAVLHVLYLIFNEGYAATSGPCLQRVELSAEAIRLAGMLYRLVPDDGEVAGLLALMLLTDARRRARVGPEGELIAMAEQDRRQWDAALIAQGTKLVSEAIRNGPVGPYLLQAAIAAVHDHATDAPSTDWPQILALYDALLALGENPVVRLNRAVAVAMVHGPVAALEQLDALGRDERIAHDHRLHAIRGHLYEIAGDRVAARESYLTGARLAVSLPQQRYLHARAARVDPAA